MALVSEIAEAIGIPESEWENRKFDVANLLIKNEIIEGNVMLMFGDYKDKFHVWIQSLDSDRIVDPTKHILDGTDPEIYVGDRTEDYSPRERVAPNPPKWDASREKYELPLYPETMTIVLDVLDTDIHSVFNVDQLEYIGKRDPNEFRGKAGELYQTMDSEGHGSLIDPEYRKLVLGK